MPWRRSTITRRPAEPRTAAGDVVVLCHSQPHAGHVRARLAPRSLAFNENKTRIVHLREGRCDFLWLNIRCYPSRKPLIRPSKASGIILTELFGIGPVAGRHGYRLQRQRRLLRKRDY